MKISAHSTKWNKAGKALAMMLLGASLLVSGCGGGEKKAANSSSSGSKRTSLTIGMTNAPKSFNPVSQPDMAGVFTMRFMYDTLLGQPEARKFTNHLAVSFDTKDKKTYTVRLNPKAKWTDGKPITTDDVLFTINLIATPKVETTLGRYIKILDGTDDLGRRKSGNALASVVKKDDTTFEFTCKKPMDPDYVKDQIGFNVPIYPKHIYEKVDPTKIGASQEGIKPTVFSGPYKLVKYVTNDHVELTANDGYVLGAPKLKKIFLKIQNGTNLVVDLKAGKVQMAAGGGIGKVPINDLEMLQKEKRLSVKTAPSLGSQFLMINNMKPEFNKHFRLALAHAINRKQLVDQLYKGHAYVFPTIYTKASPVFDASVPNPEYNVELAKKELAASGFDTSRELTMLVPLGNVQREQSGDLIQQYLQAIGLKVKIQKMDFPTLMNHRRDGTFEIFLMGISLPADPDYLAFFQPGSLLNSSKVDDPKLTKMMEDAAYESDSNKRTEDYHAIQKHLADNMYHIPLYGEEDLIIKDKDLVGGPKAFWYGTVEDVHTWYFK